MVGELLAAIPSQRPVEFARQLVCLPHKDRDDGGGFLEGDEVGHSGHSSCIPRMADSDQTPDIQAVRAW